MTPRRHGLRLAALLSLGVLASCSCLTAQVGYPPANSPYRDIPRARGPVFAVGYLPGVEGRADVGITNITTVGARYDVPLGSVMRISFGLFYAMGERFVVDPTQDTATRKSGPEPDGFLLADGEVHLLITGAKTWHRIAPYLVGGAGFLAGGGEPAADSSDYRLSTSFVFDGGAGVRWYPTRRISVQLDTRVFLLKLRYPAQFFDPSVPPDGVPPVLTRGAEEWTRQPWFRVGIGWTF